MQHSSSQHPTPTHTTVLTHAHPYPAVRPACQAPQRSRRTRRRPAGPRRARRRRRRDRSRSARAGRRRAATRRRRRRNPRTRRMRRRRRRRRPLRRLVWRMRSWLRGCVLFCFNCLRLWLRYATCVHTHILLICAYIDRSKVVGHCIARPARACTVMSSHAVILCVRTRMCVCVCVYAG